MTKEQLEKALQPYGCTLEEFDVIRGGRDHHTAWAMLQQDYLRIGEVTNVLMEANHSGGCASMGFVSFQKALSDVVLNLKDQTGESTWPQ